MFIPLKSYVVLVHFCGVWGNVGSRFCVANCVEYLWISLCPHLLMEVGLLDNVS